MKNFKILRTLLVVGALLSVKALNAAEGDSKSKEGQGSSIKDNGFYSGDKSISLTSDGEIVYLSDGKEVMRGGCIIRTDFSENLISLHKGTARKQNLEVNEKAGTITFKSEFPLNKGELNDGNSFGLYKCALTELPDKRIKLEINIEIPDAKRKPAFIGTSSLLFKLPFVCCQGKSFSVNSEKYMFTGEGKASADANVLYSDTAAKNFVFTPEDLETQLKIEIESCKSFIVRERLLNNWEGQKAYMDITASPEGRITLIFDFCSEPGQNVAGKQSDNLFNGIDFWKSDKLHVPNYKMSRNMIQNPSFEAGLRYWLYQCHGQLFKSKYKSLYECDPSRAKFGNKSLLIHCVASATSPSGLGSFAIPLIAGKKYTVSFYAMGDGPKDLRAQVRVYGANFPTILTPGTFDNITQDWKRYHCSFTAPDAGANIVFNGYYTGSNPSGEGKIWIDGVQFEEGDLTEYKDKLLCADLLSPSEDNFFWGKAQKPELTLAINSMPGSSGNVALTIQDFFSKEVWSGKYDFKTNLSGTAEVPLEIKEVLPPGIYTVEASFELADGFNDRDWFRFAIMDPLKGEHKNKDVTAHTMPIEMIHDTDGMFERATRIGIGGSNWYSYEIDESLANILKKHKHSLLGRTITDDGSKGSIVVNGETLVENLWTLHDVSPELEKKVEEASYLKAKSMPWVEQWYFSSETEPRFLVNGGTLTTDKPTDFAKLIKACRRGVKKFNSNAIFLVDGGPTNMSPQDGIKTLKSYLKALGTDVKFEGVGIHPYRNSPEDPDLDSDAESLFTMLDEAGWGYVPVYWHEGIYHENYNVPQWGISPYQGGATTNHFRMGTVSYHMGWGEKVCAAYYARSWLVALKYSDRVKCLDGHTPKPFFMDTKLTPFALQKIPNTLGNLLGNAKFVKDIRFAPQIRAYVFEDEKGRPVVAMWSHIPKVDRGDRAPVVEIDFAPPAPEVFNLMEAPMELKKGKSGYEIEITPFPVFIRGAPGSTQQMIAALGKAYLADTKTAPVTLALGINEDGIKMIFKNLVSRHFDGDYRISENGNVLKKRLQLPGMGSATFDLPSKRKISTDEITSINIPVEINEQQGQQYKLDASLQCFAAKKATGIEIDGNIDDWKNIPAIPIKNKFKYKYGDMKSDDEKNKFGAKFRVAWNQEYFYLLVEVKDDKLFYGNGDGMNNWNNDAVQVYFDCFADAREKSTEGFDTNDYSYDFCRDPKNPDKATPWRMFTPDEQLTGGVYCLKNRCLEPNIKTAFRETSGGYIYEIGFPKRYLQPIDLKRGTTMGFGLFISDHDGVGVVQSLTLTPEGTACYMKPHLWPLLILAD